MAYPDDPTKVALPQLKVPGMTSPPAATPQPTAAPASVTQPNPVQLAMRDLASSRKAPAPAPLLGADAGQTVLPVLQKGDAAMRAVGDTTVQAGRFAVGAARSGLDAPMQSNYVGDGPTDPDTNKRPVAAPVTAGAFTADLYNKMIGNPMQGTLESLPDYQKGGTSVTASVPTAPDPFAYRGAAAKPDLSKLPTLEPMLPTAVPTPAPVVASATGPTLANGFTIPENAPSDQPLRSPTQGLPQLNGQPKNIINSLSTGPAGGPVLPSLQGTPEQQNAYWTQEKARLDQRDSANVAAQQAALTVASQQDAAKARIDAANATRDSLLTQAADIASKPGSRQNRARAAQLTAAAGAAGATGAPQAGVEASMGAAQLGAATQTRGQDVAKASHVEGIGMQLPVTMRGQDITARGQDVTARGQDINAQTAGNRLGFDTQNAALNRQLHVQDSILRRQMQRDTLDATATEAEKARAFTTKQLATKLSATLQDMPPTGGMQPMFDPQGNFLGYRQIPPAPQAKK